MNGTIAAGELEVWSFRGREDFIVRVETWGMDTIIELYGPDMQLIEINDDDTADTGSFIRRHLWTSGTYWVVVRGYDDTAGTYNLVYTGAGSDAAD